QSIGTQIFPIKRLRVSKRFPSLFALLIRLALSSTLDNRAFSCLCNRRQVGGKQERSHERAVDPADTCAPRVVQIDCRSEALIKLPIARVCREGSGAEL